MATNHYRQLLATHDWYYQFSDDHRVWQKYQSRYEAIRRIQPGVDPDFSIWNEYAPRDYKMYANTTKTGVMNGSCSTPAKPSLIEELGSNRIAHQDHQEQIGLFD